MRQINLTQNQVTLVDDEDYEYLSQWKWYYNGRYATRRDVTRNTAVYMHRVIMNTPNEKYTDHVNGDRLDNRKENLRICSTSQNMFNIEKTIKNTSGYKGVYWDSSRNKWSAEIRCNNKRFHLGRFVSLDDAALAYDNAAKRYHGKFAVLNFPESSNE